MTGVEFQKLLFQKLASIDKKLNRLDSIVEQTASLTELKTELTGKLNLPVEHMVSLTGKLNRIVEQMLLLTEKQTTIAEQILSLVEKLNLAVEKTLAAAEFKIEPMPKPDTLIDNKNPLMKYLENMISKSKH